MFSKTRQIFCVLKHIRYFVLPLAIFHGQCMRQFIAVVSSSLYSSLFNEIVITRMTLHDLYIYTALCILNYRDCARELFWVRLFFHHTDVFSYGHNPWRGTKRDLPAGRTSLREALCEHCVTCPLEGCFLAGLCFCMQYSCAEQASDSISPPGDPQHVQRFLTSLYNQCGGLLFWCFSIAYAVVILSVIGMRGKVEELSARSLLFFFLWSAVYCLLCVLALYYCSITWNLKYLTPVSMFHGFSLSLVS